MNVIMGLLFLVPLFWGGPAANASEFEVVDKFTVNGHSVLHTSATINGTGVTGAGLVLTVASSTFNVLANGNVGIGTTNPTSKLAVSGLPSSSGSGGLYVCVDSNGNFYQKSSCP